MPIENDRILKNYLILCEGKDAQLFLVNYLESKALRDDQRFSQDIQVLDFGGIGDLRKYIMNLKNMEGYEAVKHILIIQDSETDVNKAISSIQNALKGSGLSTPSKCNEWVYEAKPYVAYSLFPNCSEKPIEGTLEDLCWRIVADDETGEKREDVDSFVSRFAQKHNTIRTFIHKSRIHTFLSVNDRFVTKKVGEAAKSGAFDWNNECLNSLRGLIEKAFDD